MWSLPSSFRRCYYFSIFRSTNQRSERDHKFKRHQAQAQIHCLALLSSISWILHLQQGGLLWVREARPERSYGGQEMHFPASCIILEYL